MTHKLNCSERIGKPNLYQGGTVPVPFLVICQFLVALMGLGMGVASGQNYPDRSIRMVTADPGGGTDFASRLIAQGLTDSLGQSVIVENRRGGGGVIATETVAKAPPDGYTLLVTASGFWIAPLLQKTSYDPVRDFSPITLLVSAPNILVVHPSLPAKSVKELIALARAKPGELNYASGGAGSSNHLAAELFKAMAVVSMVRIVYKGSAQGLNDLVGGHVQLMFPAASAGMPQVKSGRLRALAVTTAQRSSLAPGLPTVAASGLPGYESAAIYGMFAPAKTPATLIKRLNQEVVRVLNQADVKEKFFNNGAEAIGGSPAEFAAYIRSDMIRMGKVIKDAGIRAE